MKSKVIQPAYEGYCAMCGRPVFGAVHHLVFGRGMRAQADADGLFFPICNDCHTIGAKTERIHDNSAAEKLSKMFGQAIFERNHIAETGCTIDEAKEEFRRRYGRAYY